MKREQEMIGLLLLFCAVGLVHAQQTAASSTNVVVPPLVNFSGVLTDASGKPDGSTLICWRLSRKIL
jgi:hypothetical protein